MFFKTLSESLRVVVPIVLFALLSLYLLVSDPSVVGPY
jgi:hypothetical protein